MPRQLPDKVSAGQTVSASWLNALVDYLRYLNEQQQRRRILKGTGYLARETAAGTTLTIAKQAYTRECEVNGMLCLTNADFALRIKPKGLCVEDEEGNWDKVVQVHGGVITDHRGRETTVVGKQVKADPSNGVNVKPDSPDWGEKGWVDIATIDVKKKPSVEVYVRADMMDGTPVEAVFVTTKGGGEGEETPANRLYIPIGRVSIETVEEESRVYITQIQQGPIELGSGGSSGTMPFDVGSVQGAASEETPDVRVPCLSVEGGRVYLSDGRYAPIPAKGLKNGVGLPLKAGYVVLTVSYNEDGQATYSYEILTDPPGTALSIKEADEQGDTGI